METPQVRALIEKDLDVIKPDEIVTCDNKVVMFIENQDGVEKIVRGWSVAVYINDQEIEKCIRCKNGISKWAEYIDADLNLKKAEGDVKVYLCVAFKNGQKPPRIDITVSDIEIDTNNIRES